MKGYYVAFEAKGKAVLKECEIGKPKDNEVLLATDYSVISAGTEVANLLQRPNTGTYESGFPWQPGYCGSGHVVEVGKNVTDLKVGDRCVLAWCGHRSHVIKQADSVLKIEDDSIDMLDAAFTHISSFAFLGVRKLKIELGESVMIAGMGILGAFAVQIASLSGAVPVLVADLDLDRRALALKLGASAALSPTEDDFVDKVKVASGGEGPNAVVEVTGSSIALQQALEYIAWEGRTSLLGCTRISDVPIDFYKYVHRRGISLIGAHTFTRSKQESAPNHWTEKDDYCTFLKLLSAKKIQTKSLISKIVSPSKATEVYNELAEAKNPPLGVVFDWSKI